jgi:hypothetical protein
MVIVSMQEVKKELLKMYFNIKFDIVSKLKPPEGFLKVYFDINLDMVSKLMNKFMVILSMKKIKKEVKRMLMVILMVIVSMMKIQVILESVQQMKLKYLYQDNNQDILSRLSETRASIQVFCPRFNYMGISCPRSNFVN